MSRVTSLQACTVKSPDITLTIRGTHTHVTATPSRTCHYQRDSVLPLHSSRGHGFYRAMLCIRGTSHGHVSARLYVSVCLSVTSRSSTKTAKRTIIQTTPHDSPGTLSFLMPKISAKFDRGYPLRGRRMQVGWVKIGDF